VDDANTPGKISTQDPKQLIKLHNDYRAARSKGALSWDDALYTRAANYALKCGKGHSLVVSAVSPVNAGQADDAQRAGTGKSRIWLWGKQ
jgi:hypothetical protein